MVSGDIGVDCPGSGDFEPFVGCFVVESVVSVGLSSFLWQLLSLVCLLFPAVMRMTTFMTRHEH